MADVIKKTIENKDIVARRRFVRVSPDKMRNATYFIKNKNAEVALSLMQFSSVAAARPITLTLKNALAIAKDRDIADGNLIVKEIRVDEGPKLKRRRILHQGRSTAILKRMSHLTIVLSEKQDKKSKVTKPKEKTKRSQSGS